MNNRVLLVMKKIQNTELVTQEELSSNRRRAFDATEDTDDGATWAAYRAARAADEGTNAPYWVTVYFYHSGEVRQDYIDKLGE
jgi:hypothetical protein